MEFKQNLNFLRDDVVNCLDKMILNLEHVEERRTKIRQLKEDMEKRELPDRIKINLGGKRLEVPISRLESILGQADLLKSVSYRLASLLMCRWNRFLPRDSDGYIYFDWEATWIMPCINAMTVDVLSSSDVNRASLPDTLPDRLGFSIVSELLHAKLDASDHSNICAKTPPVRDRPPPFEYDYSSAYSLKELLRHGMKASSMVEYLGREVKEEEDELLMELLSILRLYPSNCKKAIEVSDNDGSNKRTRTIDIDSFRESENYYKVLGVYWGLTDIPISSFNVSDLVHFNVMGERMSIRKSAISKAAPDSALAKRLCGEWREQDRNLDGAGNIIMDEPVECFRALLAYIRLRALRVELGMTEAEDIATKKIFVSKALVNSMVVLRNYQSMDDVPIYTTLNDSEYLFEE